MTYAFLQQENTWNYQNYTLLKRQFLPHYLSDKGFKGTVVNQALPLLNRGSLEIALTVPFKNRSLFTPGLKYTKLGFKTTTFFSICQGMMHANLQIDEEKCLDEPEHDPAHEHHDEEDDAGDVTENQLQSSESI